MLLDLYHKHICSSLNSTLAYFHIQRHTDIHTHIFTFTHMYKIYILTCTCWPIQLTYTMGMMSAHYDTCLHTVTSHMCIDIHICTHIHTGTFSHTNSTDWHMFTLMNWYIDVHIHTRQRHWHIFDMYWNKHTYSDEVGKHIDNTCI